MGIFSDFISHRSSEDTLEFILGEKFPLEAYNAPGDHISIALNKTSFDIVISLTGLSDAEMTAIGGEAFNVYVAATDMVPFIVVKFGETLKFDLTIDILKMKKQFRDSWLASTDDAVRIFLLEGEDATLQCIRTFKFEHMKDIKDVCKKQLNSTKEEIDKQIKSIYSQINIEELMQVAQVKFVVLPFK